MRGNKESSGLPGPMAGVQRAKGDVVERMFDGRAVRHWPETERFHCLAYPCENTTSWFYMPAWSHLCMDCMTKREAPSPTTGADQ